MRSPAQPLLTPQYPATSLDVSLAASVNLGSALNNRAGQPRASRAETWRGEPALPRAPALLHGGCLLRPTLLRAKQRGHAFRTRLPTLRRRAVWSAVQHRDWARGSGPQELALSGDQGRCARPGAEAATDESARATKEPVVVARHTLAFWSSSCDCSPDSASACSFSSPIFSSSTPYGPPPALPALPPTSMLGVILTPIGRQPFLIQTPPPPFKTSRWSLTPARRYGRKGGSNEHQQNAHAGVETNELELRHLARPGQNSSILHRALGQVPQHVQRDLTAGVPPAGAALATRTRRWQAVCSDAHNTPTDLTAPTCTPRGRE
eukprot:CAMPEP_0180292982 /NCGR_PEP_ID=MMETSP0988-20121125/17190_1 /TAXON_ID=697907 /ORGANISM="non described non described, Strain CCMP2293" /LENGTH=320 /DNA_ID=CAMNT_0022269399 /DNA_START=180 /DNA_END=1141 /DNA_ORIENTATION=-